MSEPVLRLSPEDRKAVHDAVRELLPSGALFVMTRWQLYLLVVGASFAGVCLQGIAALVLRLIILLAGL